MGISKTKGKPNGKRSTKKKNRSMRDHSYKIYIKQLLPQVHGSNGKNTKLSLASDSIKVLDGIIHDLFERICTQATQFLRTTKKKTLGARELDAAVKLIFPNEIGKIAVGNSRRALTYDQKVVAGFEKKAIRQKFREISKLQ